MAVNYNLDNRLNVLNALMGEYQQWYSAVVQAGLFASDIPEVPKSLEVWLAGISVEKFNIDGQYAQQKNSLNSRHDELVKTIKAPMDEDAYKTFTDTFNGFVSDLQAFSQTVILEEWGLDILTGLKNNSVLASDLKTELEKLAREGHPFCVGLARIDDFENIDKTHEQGNLAIKKVAGYIKQCLRSYDDAYRVSRNHFILCIKQSDVIGGQRALVRLSDIMEDANESYEHEGVQKLLSVSCCVASPIPGDDIKELVDDLYQDLKQEVKESGEVVTHKEMSPLERFILKDNE